MIRLLRFLYTLVNGSDDSADGNSGAVEGGNAWLLWNAHTYSDEAP